MYDSVPTWRLYSAEQSVSLGGPLADIDSARKLARRVRRSAWWKKNVEYGLSVRLELAGRSDPQGRWIASYAQGSGLGQDTSWKVSMHPAMLNDLIVLHELAHCIAPRLMLGGRRRRPGEFHNHKQHHDHGAGFAGAMAALVREFGEGALHDELREAYEHYDVPVLTLDEYRAAVGESLIAEAEDLEMKAETRTWLADLPPQEPPPGGWRVPRFTWGDMFYFSRTQSPHVGRDRIASAVSEMEPCTRRDIIAIEKSESLPDLPRLRRIAMGYAVALNLDPIHMRHVLGIARWDCNVEIDELRPINPSWVDLVERMNGQIAQRPPRWVVDGER